RRWRAFEALNEALELSASWRKMFLPTRALFYLKRELGPGAAQKTREELEQGPEIHAVRWTLTKQLFGMQIKLAGAVIAGVVGQLFLAAVAVLTIVPGITRSFAGWVQIKLSATIGDSFIFVTSPITGAAIL